MDCVWINHGNWLSWAVWPTVARRVSDQINHYIWGGSGIDKSMVVRWAYIKELAVTNTREKEIGIITLYMGGRCSKG